MKKENCILGIAIITAIVLIAGCIGFVEILGEYLNNIIYTRAIFGVGIFVGVMTLWAGQLFGYFLIKWKNKK